MAKKKRVVSKPTKVVAVSEKDEIDSTEKDEPDLPSIQTEVEEQPAPEIFLDSCENLEADLVDESPIKKIDGLRPVSWAEEAENDDFHAKARDIWSKFKSNQGLTPRSGFLKGL
uniref:Uncharacterized protein n=1 Tax=Cannabis sativa TaxID=3483 RepID=A0A803P1R3_CANSA